DPAMPGQIGHAGEPAAFFVDRPADLHRSVQRYPRPADRFHGKERRGNARLRVGRAAPVDASITDNAAEWIHRPSVPGRDDVEMAVEVQVRSRRASRTSADHVETWVRRGVRGGAG